MTDYVKVVEEIERLEATRWGRFKLWTIKKGLFWGSWRSELSWVHRARRALRERDPL